MDSVDPLIEDGNIVDDESYDGYTVDDLSSDGDDGNTAVDDV